MSDIRGILNTDLYEHHYFKVEKNHDLIRIDKFLLLRLPNTSRTKIQKSISLGYVFLCLLPKSLIDHLKLVLGKPYCR